MENLTFDLPAGGDLAPDAAPTPRPVPPWVLVGVLASGNLEILVEPNREAAGKCCVEVQTSALGFGEVWRAVVEDFTTRHGAAVAGLRFTVHDSGATPAVVSLRLDQALREFRSAPPGN